MSDAPLITFTVHRVDRNKREAIVAENLQSPVLPRIGEWIDVGNDSYPVEEVHYEFRGKQLYCILVTVYG